MSGAQEQVPVVVPPRGGTQKLHKQFKISKPTDMTIYWKALQKHFLMVPLFFRFIHFRGKDPFSEVFSKNLSANCWTQNNNI
jgi:hypothetical protein